MNLKSQNFAGASSARHSVSFGCPAHFDEARLKLGSASATADDFTITLNSKYGAAHDVLLYTQTMSAVSSLRAIGTEEIRFLAGDALDVIWPNTGNISYGLEVRYIA
jgi:hypothetical protein